MKNYKGQQAIGQLEKRKGGYFYLQIPATIVNQFKNKRQTRFICVLDKKISFQCGLNHLGDGNFFIIISTKNLKATGKLPGETISFEIKEDPNPLGVEIPEVLQVLLEQDEQMKTLFDGLTMGKKRSIIHAISKIKDIDKQVGNAMKLLKETSKPRLKKSL
jgi:hypothetical protein